MVRPFSGVLTGLPTMRQGYWISGCSKMSYKDQYQPSYILGRYYDASPPVYVLTLILMTDPETYTWDLLDVDYLNRLSSRKYVSMSLERQLHLPPHKIANVNELGLDEDSLKRLWAYQRNSGTGRSGDGAHRAGMPGLIPLAVIEDEIDLGRWPIQVGNRLAQMEVRGPVPHYVR